MSKQWAWQSAFICNIYVGNTIRGYNCNLIRKYMSAKRINVVCQVDCLHFSSYVVNCNNHVLGQDDDFPCTNLSK